MGCFFHLSRSFTSLSFVVSCELSHQYYHFVQATLMSKKSLFGHSAEKPQHLQDVVVTYTDYSVSVNPLSSILTTARFSSFRYYLLEHVQPIWHFLRVSFQHTTSTNTTTTEQVGLNTSFVSLDEEHYCTSPKIALIRVECDSEILRECQKYLS